MKPFGLEYRIGVIGVILFLLAACTPINTAYSEPSSDVPVSTSVSPGQLVNSSINESPAPNEGTAEQIAIQPAEVTTTLEPPEIDWRESPIMPDVSQRVLEIYQEGQAQGRNPQNFSVIGDCQAIPFVFLGPFARGEQKPDNSEIFLWDAIGYFKGSFNRWGVVARGGFTAASILSPIQADPHYCKLGETPLTCEYRLNNPAFVFITLETWLDPGTIDRYEIYLRQIMDYVIERGSVPILLTKADSSEIRNGTHVINPIIVRVARDYDVPVVNVWRAAQYLDNYGIDHTREGFHLSQEGYNLKNTLALRALYTFWKAVEQGDTNNTRLVNPAATQTLQSAPGPQSIPQFTAPDCDGGCIFFTTASSKDGAVTPQGVYAYNYNSRKLTLVLGEGFDLQDVSEDGQRLLVNQTNHLYEINPSIASASLVSESFLWLGKQGAYWNSGDSKVIFIDQNNPVRTETGGAFNLFPSIYDEALFFESGICTVKDYCQSSGIYRRNLDQSPTRLDSYSQLVFSPNGEFAAFLNPTAATKNNYYHISYLLLEEPDRGIISRRIFYFPAVGGFMVYPDVRYYDFSPDGNKLFIIYDVYSNYFEKSLRFQTYMIDLPTGILHDFGSLSGVSGSLKPKLVWAPQGDEVLFFLTDVTPNNQYSISVFQTSLGNEKKLTLYDERILTNNDYFYITNLYWR